MHLSCPAVAGPAGYRTGMRQLFYPGSAGTTIPAEGYPSTLIGLLVVMAVHLFRSVRWYRADNRGSTGCMSWANGRQTVTKRPFCMHFVSARYLT